MLYGNNQLFCALIDHFSAFIRMENFRLYTLMQKQVVKLQSRTSFFLSFARLLNLYRNVHCYNSIRIIVGACLIKKMCAVHDIFFHKLSMSPINKKYICDSVLELQIHRLKMYVNRK